MGRLKPLGAPPAATMLRAFVLFGVLLGLMGCLGSAWAAPDEDAVHPPPDLHASGFVVEAGRIRGKLASCRIKSRKEDGDMINMVAACATDIMLSDVQFSVQVIDDNNAQTPFDG
jgi:hypothetical protein